MIRSIVDVVAPAKLNLFLHLVGMRADGYHLLHSLFVLIDWCDTLHFELRTDGALARHDLGPRLPPDDLCLRAARLLQSESATPLGADISIAKRVPWGAGLGGGSSDAASTLLALNRLWNLHWSRARLLRLALQLGADVPFFVNGRNAVAEGIGERLTPVEAPLQRYAVVKPAAVLETRAVFARRRLARENPADILESSTPISGTGADAGVITDMATPVNVIRPGFGRNDLQAAAEAECTEMLTVGRWLQERYGNSRMSGSGSVMFANVDPATIVLPALPVGWIGRLCTGLPWHPLVAWSV